MSVQFLHSNNTIPNCMILQSTLGYQCFCYEAYQDVAGTGHNEIYLIYCMHFTFNLIEGPEARSVRVFNVSRPYEIGWFHEVSNFQPKLNIQAVYQESLLAQDDRGRDGILSIGDFPFNVLLPEPVICHYGARLYHAHSFEDYDPNA